MKKGDAPKAAMSWSSGKDSSMAFYKVIKSGKYDVISLLTTVNTDYGRVSIHGVRKGLLQKQAESMGIPPLNVELPRNSSNKIYEDSMQAAIHRLRDLGVEFMIFGDIFLQDVKDYRISMMEGTGIQPVFPLWGLETSSLACEIIHSGIKAKVVCLDPGKLDRRLGGTDFDSNFLKALPAGVDPCGENGEFHTFVYNAPFFRKPIRARPGMSVLRDGFYFTDLVAE